MREYILERVLEVGEYIAKTGATVRDAGKKFDISKSTVHFDMTKRLPKVDSELAKKVRKVLDVNFDERHIRGGEQTKRKYSVK